MRTTIYLSRIRKVAHMAGFHCPCQATEVFCLLLQGLTNEEIMRLMSKKYSGYDKRWKRKSEKKKFLYFLRCYISLYHHEEFLDYAARQNWKAVTENLDTSDKKYHELRLFFIQFLREVAGMLPPYKIEVDDWILSPRGLILHGDKGYNLSMESPGT